MDFDMIDKCTGPPQIIKLRKTTPYKTHLYTESNHANYTYRLEVWVIQSMYKLGPSYTKPTQLSHKQQ